MGRMSRLKLTGPDSGAARDAAVETRLTGWLSAQILYQVGNDRFDVTWGERRTLLLHLADRDTPACLGLLKRDDAISGMAGGTGSDDNVFTGAFGKVRRDRGEGA